MSDLIHSPAWRALTVHRSAIIQHSLREMFHADPARFDKFSLQLPGLLLDYSKNQITEETRALLLNLGRQAKLEDWMARLFSGVRVTSVI